MKIVHRCAFSLYDRTNIESYAISARRKILFEAHKATHTTSFIIALLWSTCTMRDLAHNLLKVVSKKRNSLDTKAVCCADKTQLQPTTCHSAWRVQNTHVTHIHTGHGHRTGPTATHYGLSRKVLIPLTVICYVYSHFHVSHPCRSTALT